MFHASVNDEAYDLDRWGQFYRPFGVDSASDDNSGSTFSNRSETPKASPKTSKPVEVATETEEDAPVATKAAADKVDSSDILARIRARQKQS